MKNEIMNIVRKDKKKVLFLMLLAFVAIALLIFGNRIGGEQKDSADTSVQNSGGVSAPEIGETEKELTAILEQMSGVGRAEVVIRWDGAIEEEYAYNTENNSTEKDDGTRENGTRQEMVLLDGDSAPVVVKKHYPKILGVLIVAEGAADSQVRERLLNAAATYLDIGKNRIEVMTMEGN